MKTTVRAAIADIFKLECVDYVFGHTGGHIMLLWDAVDKARIKTVFNKQEGNATYMADAYARLSGKASVVLGTSGPGIQNTVTGLASAYLDSIPVIAIGAGVSTEAAGRNALQESSGRGRATDQLMIFKGITKQATLAQSPDSIPQLVREAFRTALSGRPGPVYIEIPSNFWNVQIEYNSIKPARYKNTNTPLCNVDDCKKIAEALYKAERPVILIGEGALENEIGPKLINFINKIKVPFYVSPKAKDFTDEYHDLYIGALRWHRKMPKEYGYLVSSDFILFLGDRMGQWEFEWGYENIFKVAKLAQIDPDPSEIGKVYNVDFSAVGSISSFIESTDFKAHKNSNLMLEEAKKYNYKLIRPRRYPDKGGMNPLNLNNIIEESIPDECVVVADTAFAGSMAINKFRTRLSQRFLISDNNSPMGYSLPAAIGASFYFNKTVVCLIGDGSFQMTCNELGTLMNYANKVIFVVEDNGGCMSIKTFLDSVVGKSNPKITTFINPDFTKIAEAYGMIGLVACSTKEFEDCFKKALNSKNATIIDAKINQSLMEWE